MSKRLVPAFAGPLLFIVAAFVLAGCFGDPETGPVEIKYGRDTCDYCRMIISDPRYAAQIRGGERHKAHKFDDIGDAVHFLRMQDWKDDPKVEFWVMNSEDAQTWLDARKAYFVRGAPTPMDYGYAAVADGRDGAIAFEEMSKAVIGAGPSSRCLPGSPGHEPPITPYKPKG